MLVLALPLADGVLLPLAAGALLEPDALPLADGVLLPLAAGALLEPDALPEVLLCSELGFCSWLIDGD